MAAEASRSQVAYARLAGAMFLLVDAFYAVGLTIVGRFRVPGDVLATAQHVAQSEVLYRVGLASSVLGALCTVLIGVGLYGALRPVGHTLALTGLTFRTAEATLFGVATIVAYAFVPLFVGIDASGFSAAQLSAIAAVRGGFADAGYNIAALFFSLGSTAFFYLFLRSRYLPTWLSLLGFFGSLLVPFACFGSLVFGLGGVAYWALWAPVGAAEVVGGIWLLLRGLDLRAATPRAQAAGAVGATGAAGHAGAVPAGRV